MGIDTTLTKERMKSFEQKRQGRRTGGVARVSERRYEGPIMFQSVGEVMGEGDGLFWA